MARNLERIENLEVGQRQTNAHLASIDATLHTISRVFELMNDRVEHLEVGQNAIVDRLERIEGGQRLVVERLDRLEGGQKLVVDRLDRLIEASTRERTFFVERLARVESRLDAVEEKLERHS